MNTPVKRITATLKSHAGLSSEEEAAALDDMASHNFAGFFGMLFEIDQRIQSEGRQHKVQPDEN